MAKLVMIVFFIVILYCLGSGVFYLIKTGGDSRIKLARALTWRIALSLALFGLLMLAYVFGWIAPHQIMVAPPGY
jgi:hypothetical protein